MSRTILAHRLSSVLALSCVFGIGTPSISLPDGAPPKAVALLDAIYAVEPWRSSGEYSSSAWTQLFIAARRLQASTPNDVKWALSHFHGPNLGERFDYSYKPESRILLVLRVAFDLPEEAPIRNQGFFGGFSGDPWIVTGNTMNRAWPLSFASGKPAMVAQWRDGEGRVYDPVGEYTYFAKNYRKRDLSRLLLVPENRRPDSSTTFSPIRKGMLLEYLQRLLGSSSASTVTRSNEDFVQTFSMPDREGKVIEVRFSLVDNSELRIREWLVRQTISSDRLRRLPDAGAFNDKSFVGKQRVEVERALNIYIGGILAVSAHSATWTMARSGSYPGYLLNIDTSGSGDKVTAIYLLERDTADQNTWVPVDPKIRRRIKEFMDDFRKGSPPPTVDPPTTSAKAAMMRTTLGCSRNVKTWAARLAAGVLVTSVATTTSSVFAMGLRPHTATGAHRPSGAGKPHEISIKDLIEALHCESAQPPEEFRVVSAQGYWLREIVNGKRTDLPAVLTPTDAMRELVRRGAVSLPALLEHLTDERPTGIVVARTNWFIWGVRYEPRDPLHPPEAKQRLSAKAVSEIQRSMPKSYAFRVGDLCFVAVGQIVNRYLNTIERVPTNVAWLTSPCSTTELAEAVRQDWQGLTVEQHKQSLISDMLHLGDYGTETKALPRLLFYYPKEGEKWVKRLLGRRVFPDAILEDLLVPSGGAKPDSDSSEIRIRKYLRDHGQMGKDRVRRTLIWAVTFPRGQWSDERERNYQAALPALSLFFPGFDPTKPQFVDAVPADDQAKLVRGLIPLHVRSFAASVRDLRRRAEGMRTFTREEAAQKAELISACDDWLSSREE